jgi:membrane-bound serine protease (ClpP class)
MCSLEGRICMVQLCIILLVLGLVALVLEMCLPGVEVFGIAGIIALLISAVLAVLYVPFGWFIVAGQVMAVAVFFVSMYRYMHRKQLQGKLILTENLQEDVPKVCDYKAMVGQEGRTVTALRPMGEVDFNGTRMEVTSGGPMIEKGIKIRVTGTQENRIFVSAVEGN